MLWLATPVAAETTPSPGVPDEMSWSLQLPKDDRLTYKGMVSFDDAGQGTAGILYVAPNPLAFLAEVVTHGAIVEAAKNRQKDTLQSAADAVLTLYRPFLDRFGCKELMRRGLEMASLPGRKQLIEQSQSAGDSWLIKASPVFWLSQDQTAIILDNNITIHAPGAASSVAYQNNIRIVSASRTASDITDYWAANDGARLKEESASLYAQSLEIARAAMRVATTEGAGNFKTFRYREGNHEKMERGQLMSESCNRAVIRNLRGWLISIPLPGNPGQESSTAQCGNTPDPESSFSVLTSNAASKSPSAPVH